MDTEAIANEEHKLDENKEQVSSDEETEQKDEDICGDGGVIKKVLKKGEGWRKPEKGAEVRVHYVGKLTDGSVFDSSVERNEPFVFTLGKGEVIKGWDKGVAEMKKGEKALLTIRSDYGYGKAGSPPKIPADATLLFEVELLEWIEEKDITEKKDGGVFKKILKEGDGWKNPKEDSKVKVHLIGKREGGTTFEERKNFEFVVGAEEVVAAVDIAVQSMKKGEQALISVKNDSYGYGSNGNLELGINPNEKISYEIELLEFSEEKESWDMSIEEKFQTAEKKKEEGNKLFQQTKYQRALKKYKKALDFFEYDGSLKEDEKEKAKKLKIPCMLNSAACKLKLKELKDAKDFCDKVLNLDPQNVKALYRRGIAHMDSDNWQESERDFNKALELDPNNKDVKKELLLLKKRQAEQDKKDKKHFGGIFEKMAKQDEQRKKRKTEQEQKEAKTSEIVSQN